MILIPYLRNPNKKRTVSTCARYRQHVTREKIVNIFLLHSWCVLLAPETLRRFMKTTWSIFYTVKLHHDHCARYLKIDRAIYNIDGFYNDTIYILSFLCTHVFILLSLLHLSIYIPVHFSYLFCLLSSILCFYIWSCPSVYLIKET